MEQSIDSGKKKEEIILNNNETTPKRGEENYDPAHKLDLIWDVLTHNTNAITKHACLDVVGDETIWGHQGFGEPASGLAKKSSTSQELARVDKLYCSLMSIIVAYMHTSTDISVGYNL
eukprot:1186195-Ditylum_brightwellii.AAC.1